LNARVLHEVCKMQNRDKSAQQWVINGADRFLIALFETLCSFKPLFRKMAGVPLALTDDATELIFALSCSVPLDLRPSARQHD